MTARGAVSVRRRSGLTGALRERMRRAGASAARAAETLARSAAAPYHLVKSLSIVAPERLRIAPPDIRTADSTVADEIYAGYFTFEGKTVQAQAGSPFAAAAPSPGWRRALTGFAWLRHLRAADKALAQVNAQALVADFFALGKPPPDDPAMEPPVVARRMLSFLAQSPALLDGADAEFYDAFMEQLGQSARLLWRALAGPRTRGADRVLCAVALVEFAVCADNARKIAPQVVRVLAEELDRQILSDGGHVGRNPQTGVDLLLDLLPLRQVFAARGVQTPAAVLRAIDRALPMLRMLQHGDGSLALFNGMGATALDGLLSVLAYEDTRGAPPINAPYSGYQRVEAGDALVIVDAGGPPPLDFSRGAHAGCLSFELSFGAERVVVNCGAPAPAHEEARELARATAAHSTLVVEERSSARFAPPAARGARAGRILSGPRQVEVARRAIEDATELTLSHDGYARDFGLVHERRLILTSDGAELAGRDRLREAPGVARRNGARDFAVRFHLHPRVQVAPRDAQSLLLHLGNGETVLFEAEGVSPQLEESIFFAAQGGARKCAQIVLRGAMSHPEANWSFRRMAGAVPRAGDV